MGTAPWARPQPDDEQAPWARPSRSAAAITPHQPASAGVSLVNGRYVPSQTTDQIMHEQHPFVMGAHDVATGLLQSAGKTLTSADDWARKHLPAFMTNTGMGFGKPENLADVRQSLSSKNTAQSVGKGIGDVAQFLVPGAGEEDAANAAVRLAPKAEGLIRPAAHIGYNALTSGLVNKAEGGNLGTGAAAGGAAGAVGEGLRAVAPHLAESALNIRKLDRAYGKGGGSIGRAALDETRGWRPGTVAASARDVMENDIAPKLESVTNRASVRPAPKIRGFLEPPAEEIRLGNPFVPHMPGDLVDAEPFPPQNVAQARVIRNGRGQILPRSERTTAFPDESGRMPPARNPYNGQMLPQKIENLPFTRRAFMTGEGDELPPVIDQRVGPGVMLRKPEMSASVPPTIEANPSASLRGVRGVLSNASGRAARQGERTTVNQLQPMTTHLNEAINGEPILENITPRQMLDLKRGFGNEFIHRWNPETMEGVKATAAKTYHEMAQELHRVVPETEPLDRRYSLLAPIAKRAESVELNAPTAQRIAHRVAAHTGALTGGVFGAQEGYRKDGVPGALAGGLLGVALPEMITSPTAEMGAARMLNRGAKPLSRIGTGALLQLDRKPKNN